MPCVYFPDAMEALALRCNVNPEIYYRFIRDAKMISTLIAIQLCYSKCHFAGCLDNLYHCAAYVDNNTMDLPLTFDLFLPIKLPLPKVKTSFNRIDHSVRFTQRHMQHPFLFGNCVNAKRMNLILQEELKWAVSHLNHVEGLNDVVYKLHSSCLYKDGAPIVHEIVALQRGTNIAIRFDFVLALEFNDTEVPLPRYFRLARKQKWYAYSLVPQDSTCDSADWAVLIPKWQHASVNTRMVRMNTMQLLYKMFSKYKCNYYTNPMSLKFGFAMASEHIAQTLAVTPIGELLVGIMAHQVCCNWIATGKLLSEEEESGAANSDRIFRQKGRALKLFNILTKGCNDAVIDLNFVRQFRTPNVNPLVFRLPAVVFDETNNLHLSL